MAVAIRIPLELAKAASLLATYIIIIFFYIQWSVIDGVLDRRALQRQIMLAIVLFIFFIVARARALGILP